MGFRSSEARGSRIATLTHVLAPEPESLRVWPSPNISLLEATRNFELEGILAICFESSLARLLQRYSRF